MATEQPLVTTTIRRPFHWGIVVIRPAGASPDLPDVPSGTLVSTNGEALIVLVRHAQDVESFEGDFSWAETEIVVRQLVEPP